MTTFSNLTIGSVINFYRPTTADDTNYVVLRQYQDRFGNWTEVLNMETLEKEQFMSHTQVDGFWSLVKEN